MSHTDFENFLKIPNFFYKSAGVIINNNEFIGKQEKFLIDLVFILGLINLNACMFGEFVYVKLFLSERKMVEAVMTLSYIGFVFMGDFKILYIRWKRQQLKNYLNVLFAIFPKTQKDIQMYEMKRYLQKCTKIMVAFSVLYMLLIWTYNFYALLEYLIVDKWFHWRIIGQQLPYTVYVPWNWHGHWTYYLLYASQAIAGYTSAAGQIANDLLLSATATQVIMHYDFLAKSVEKFKVTNGNRDSFLEAALTSEKNLMFLKNFIGYHNLVLGLSDQMNSLFSISLLLNFMTSSFVICFVGFQMTIGVSTDVLLKLFMFLFSSMAQVFLICYYGEELKNASENIALAVYQHDWHNADLRYKKMLLIIAERAQKPAMLRATSFFSISRRTMTDLLQLSYKFFAMLRTSYGQ